MLLEHLVHIPADDRLQAGRALLEGVADPADADALVLESCAVLDAPALQPFWGKNSLAEVPVTAHLPQIGRIHGIIDRLIIAPDHVIAIDFKSNRIVPAQAEMVPLGLIRQMGAYFVALKQIYPDKRIECGLVWTYDQSYTALPEQLMQSGLASLTTS